MKKEDRSIEIRIGALRNKKRSEKYCTIRKRKKKNYN